MHNILEKLGVSKRSVVARGLRWGGKGEMDEEVKHKKFVGQ